MGVEIGESKYANSCLLRQRNKSRQTSEVTNKQQKRQPTTTRQSPRRDSRRMFLGAKLALVAPFSCFSSGGKA